MQVYNNHITAEHLLKGTVPHTSRAAWEVWVTSARYYKTRYLLIHRVVCICVLVAGTSYYKYIKKKCQNTFIIYVHEYVYICTMRGGDRPAVGIYTTVPRRVER